MNNIPDSLILSRIFTSGLPLCLECAIKAKLWTLQVVAAIREDYEQMRIFRKTVFSRVIESIVEFSLTHYLKKNKMYINIDRGQQQFGHSK